MSRSELNAFNTGEGKGKPQWRIRTSLTGDHADDPVDMSAADAVGGSPNAAEAAKAAEAVNRADVAAAAAAAAEAAAEAAAPCHFATPVEACASLMCGFRGGVGLADGAVGALAGVVWVWVAGLAAA